MKKGSNIGIKELIFLIFVFVALLFFIFPLIISLITKNYWYFFLFFVSWIPSLVIGKIGVHLCFD